MPPSEKGHELVTGASWSSPGYCEHGGPYTLLAVSGEQGSAKTVISKSPSGDFIKDCIAFVT
jgi:hypothetical protein